MARINQSISGDSLSPEESNSVESVPFRSLSVLQSSMEKTQLSGLKNNSHHNYEPPKVNNFIDIKENEIDMQSSSDRRDTKEDFQSFKARDTSPEKEDVIVLCNLEEPASIVKVEA